MHSMYMSRVSLIWIFTNLYFHSSIIWAYVNTNFYLIRVAFLGGEGLKHQRRPRHWIDGFCAAWRWPTSPWRRRSPTLGSRRLLSAPACCLKRKGRTHWRKLLHRRPEARNWRRKAPGYLALSHKRPELGRARDHKEK